MGKPKSLDMRRKLSLAKKRQWADPAFRQKMVKAMRTPESKTRRSKSHQGLQHSQETKQKISAWQQQHKKDTITDKTREALSRAAVKRTKKGYQCRTFFSEKTQRGVRYRSSYELVYYTYLEGNPRVLWYEEETLSIPYRYHGRNKLYVPDVRIHWVSGIIELVEVCHSWSLRTEMRQCKLSAGRAFCFSKGWEFSVATETHLCQLISSQADLFGDLIADRKVQRLLGQASQAKEPGTSAGRLPSSGKEVDEIVRHSWETRREQDKEPARN